MATYPIKMLRDEDRQPFVPFTNAAAVVDKNNDSLQELMDNGKYKIQNNTTTSSAGKGVLDAYQGKVLNDKFNKYVPLSQKGVANGVATLDGEGKVPSSQLPSYVDDVIESYIVNGSTALSAGWLSTTNGGAALTPEKGKIYLVMTAGQYQNHQYRWGGSTYVLCNPSDVNSVNGMTGIVVLKNLTIQRNGTQVGDKFNGTTDEVINISVPTNNNQLTNGAGYITSAGSITGNAATATNATNDKNGLQIDTNYLKKSGGVMTGDLEFSDVTSGFGKGVYFHTGGNDGGRIVGGSNGANQGYLEIATCDDGNEPIYVRQYSSAGGYKNYTGTPRTITLLDSAGNTSFPGSVTATNGFIGNITGNVTGNVTGNINGNVNGFTIEDRVYPIISITKTLTIGTDWIDTGIEGNALASGTYIIQVSGFKSDPDQMWGLHYTGLMYWMDGETNSTGMCEIPLHWSGHASNGKYITIRTKNYGRGNSEGIDNSVHLQIACNHQLSESNITFKFKRIM